MQSSSGSLRILNQFPKVRLGVKEFHLKNQEFENSVFFIDTNNRNSKLAVSGFCVKFP